MLSYSQTVGAGFPAAGCLTHPKQAVTLVTLQPPAVSLIHREQRNRISHGFPSAADKGTLLSSDMAFSSAFSIFARKKTAQARRARHHTEKFHDKKAYFPKTSCQKAYFPKTSCQIRENMISYPQGAGYPVAGRRTHSAGLSCCNTADCLFFAYTKMVA